MNIKALIAEVLGTAFLLIAIVGSALQMEHATAGNLDLEGHAVAIGLTLAVMIAALVKVSGGHFNPAVSVVMAWRGEMKGGECLFYIVAQVIGAMVGVMLAHIAFGQPVLGDSAIVRGGGNVTAETVATFGLVLVLLGVRDKTPQAMPWAVGLYIAAAVMFSSSTAFANPAVTLGRMFTDSLAGIDTSGALLFMGMQFVGALLAAIVYRFVAAK